MKLTRLLLTAHDDIALPERMVLADSDLVITHKTGCRELIFRLDIDVEPASVVGADWLFDQHHCRKTLLTTMWWDWNKLLGACHITHAMAGQLGPSNKLTVRLIIHGAGVLV
jgi:hypothetical protein